MHDDFKELLAALNTHKVRYLVIGGYAVIHHSQPRATKDLDIFILPAPKNAAAVVKALKDFGAPTANISADDFTKRRLVYRFGVPPFAIDVLPEISGIAFEAAWKNRVAVVVDPVTGLTSHFISREDLIIAKLAAGRPRDLADVDELRKAAQAVKLAKVPKHPRAKAKKKRTPKPGR